jgi:hypothetical protein
MSLSRKIKYKENPIRNWTQIYNQPELESKVKNNYFHFIDRRTQKIAKDKELLLTKSLFLIDNCARNYCTVNEAALLKGNGVGIKKGCVLCKQHNI